MRARARLEMRGRVGEGEGGGGGGGVRGRVGARCEEEGELTLAKSSAMIAPGSIPLASACVCSR